MPSEAKVQFAAICDAVYRDEETGKAILAGVFCGDIIMGRMPGIFRFALYAEVMPAVSSGTVEMDFQFYMGGKKTGGFKSEGRVERPGQPFVVSTPAVSLRAEKPTTFELRLSLNGGKATKVLKKRVLLKDHTATASPPPP